MGNEIILTQKEVDAGKSPAHCSCRTIEVNGEICYLFYGRTGNKKARVTDTTFTASTTASEPTGKSFFGKKQKQRKRK
jgi:hypothetical protein